MYCESKNDSDVQQGNSIFWKEIDGNIPIKVWKSIKQLGIQGDKDDEVFEGIVRDLEKRDQINAAFVEVENQIGCS